MKLDSMGFADWVRSHALSLDTLDPDAGLDDLEPVRELIGNARVVAIGEAAHRVREFSLVRHRLLRFLAERCGFTVLAFEAPTVGSGAIDAWLHGGAGTVAEIASRASMVGLLECREVHDLLAWSRAHDRTASRPLRWLGTVPGGGSPLPGLEAVAGHLRSADPDALPLLEQPAERARKYHDSEIFTTLSRYAALEPGDQDVQTATLSRLRFRLETMAVSQRGTHREQEHAAALRHLGFAWRLDHFHRDVAGRGLPVGSAALDECMAEEVLQLIEDEPETRVVLALHNVHIRKVPLAGPAGLFPPATTSPKLSATTTGPSPSPAATVEPSASAAPLNASPGSRSPMSRCRRSPSTPSRTRSRVKPHSPSPSSAPPAATSTTPNPSNRHEWRTTA
ncbi:erythromycin esterase family protein [Amycolatopsis sp. NPDC023774]|uniref:erythromycin esterase family protein n=1 Tax=Amycolatopsis sp. NPDC023774 TaxID=3155015 RepID=UPI003407E2DF